MPVTGTYRLQLHHEFGFADAERIVPYLADLGVSHLYLSPILQAATGSLHGYDVLDHGEIAADLGGRAAFESLARAARAHDLGIIVDAVSYTHLDVSWPKPLEELLAAAYATYRPSHPWLAEEDLSPTTVVRDLFERAMTLGEFIAFYQLQRAEGLVLRYLTEAYRALRQTVPDGMKTEELEDLIAWLGELVRQTDSSLLDE